MPGNTRDCFVNPTIVLMDHKKYNFMKHMRNFNEF